MLDIAIYARITLETYMAREKARQAQLEAFPYRAAQMIEQWRIEDEKRREDSIAERRHQELCAAIRDSGLRRFGFFL